jgi:hypothetical protein
MLLHGGRRLIPRDVVERRDGVENGASPERLSGWIRTAPRRTGGTAGLSDRSMRTLGVGALGTASMDAASVAVASAAGVAGVRSGATSLAGTC